MRECCMTANGGTAQDEWEATLSTAISSDVLWKLDVYRASMFLLHLARADGRALRARGVGRRITDQLLEAAASVSGNLSEGYSRSTRPDRIRFIDYALGSCRECQSWYFAAGDELQGDTVEERLQLLARTRSLLLGLIRAQRARGRTEKQFEP